jgi:hypothetical protein
MVDVLERTVRRHPRTTFVACHLANLDYDLERLGRLLYGTDMGFDRDMYETTFRILEKLYRANAIAVMRRASENARTATR